jgi:hypothetical protein
MESHDLREEWESRLVGKVCDLCRGLETDISAVLTVMSGLGILWLEIHMVQYTDGSIYNGSIYYFGLMMIMMFLEEEMVHELVIW